MLDYSTDQNSVPLRIYYGWRLGQKTTADDVVVYFIPDMDNDAVPQELPLCLDIANHSPTGFAWGYNGSGPAQLALAILTTMIGSDDAKHLYHQFKDDFVAKWGNAWSITSVEIEEWLAQPPTEMFGTDSGKHFG